MGTVTIHAAKTHLSRLIARAAAGEEIIILRGRIPVARLTAISPETSKRRFGAYKGEFEVPESFFDPLPAEELAAFEGEGYDANPLGHARAAVVDDRRPTPVAKGARSHRRRRS
ncbi:MAG TPA: type II toxin-antitoxin system Phd/YefM family antitoxin [Hyphomicrobiaceae bacterium]|nr:type II toxin-antitoxin system Phd/YefM family antitoxin [Hyphomicrobiaceae bacterium]